MIELTSLISVERIEFDTRNFDTRNWDEEEIKERHAKGCKEIRTKISDAALNAQKEKLFPYMIVSSLESTSCLCSAYTGFRGDSRSLIGHVSKPSIDFGTPVIHTIVFQVDERLKDGLLYIFFEPLDPFHEHGILWPVDDLREGELWQPRH